MYRKSLALCVLLFLFGGLAAMAENEWISLFDGKTLNGWKANEDPASFKIVDGAILCDGPRCHLFYTGAVEDAQFKNFELKADIKANHDSNSGIFIHTRFQDSGWPNHGYEIQVNNTHGKHGNYHERKKTGSLYGIRNVYKQLVQDDEWFTLHITVIGKRIQVKVNDILVVDYTEPRNPVRPNRTANWVLSEGTFALQCHDPNSKVYFKNIRVKPLPDRVTNKTQAPPTDDIYRQIIELGIKNFPMIDLHTHLKGGLTVEEVLRHGRRTGIFHGIAPNCGLGFPITDDQGIYDYMDKMQGYPCFLGMQAEGREWVNMFSKKAIAQFDYVFSDAMTFRDNKGRRTRLWMPDEVYIDDKQDFMDMYVEKIVGVISNEPIDIYVNPTYLPAEIAGEYDALWTQDRMQKVIDAAVKHGVAIEINSRFKIPSAAFIKQAKRSGCQFALGTNNGGADDMGRLPYSLQMVKECNLTWKDMFVPQPKNR